MGLKRAIRGMFEPGANGGRGVNRIRSRPERLGGDDGEERRESREMRETTEIDDWRCRWAELMPDVQFQNALMPELLRLLSASLIALVHIGDWASPSDISW